MTQDLRKGPDLPSANSNMSLNRALRDLNAADERPELHEGSVRDVQPSAREVITSSGLLFLLRFGRFKEKKELENERVPEGPEGPEMPESNIPTGPETAESNILTVPELPGKT